MMTTFPIGKAFDPQRDIPSLAAKVILITGGDTGLGRETALQLAKHNPRRLFLAVQPPSQAEEAIEEIQQVAPQCDVSYIQLDLSSFASIEQAAKAFTKQADRLDVLINNAGVMGVPFSKTKEGYEIHFGINHIGHALLTHLLLPTLLHTAEQPNSDVRVINISSEGHKLAPGLILDDQDRLAHYYPFRLYGHSKLANILHARALSKRCPSITAVAVHPGVILTGLYKSVFQTYFLSKHFLPWMPMMRSVQAGARSQLWAVAAPRALVRQGYYWKPVGRKDGGSSWYAQKDALVDELWAWTEKELSAHGFDASVTLS